MKPVDLSSAAALQITRIFGKIIIMEAPPPLRIAISSDQPIYRRGLSGVLLTVKDLQLVGEACCAAEVLQLCQLTEPDLLLIDVNHSTDECIQLVRQVSERWPNIKIVLLMDGEGLSALDRLDGKLVYHFSRDITEDEFKAALIQVRRDERVHDLQEGVTHVLFTSTGDEPDSDTREYSRIAYSPALSRNEEVMTRELEMAGKIQADILPEEAPLIPGWDISAVLLPARETSGDFYDFIPLAPRKWALVVADVSDKGMGAALLMALSSTLFRTFAGRYPTLPAVTLNTVSERILSDTRGGMFVTAFLGVFEPHTGRLVYANGGHPPGYLISLRRGKESIERLRPTGMAMGVDEQTRWRQKEVRMVPGDLLVLYTDGITEAQSPQGDFFGEDRLLEVVLARRNSSARQIQDALIDEVHRFAGSAQDDVAVIVMRREM
jgi:DNA-binding NarL/FixJ family response regulator